MVAFKAPLWLALVSGADLRGGGLATGEADN